jgi:hypothetical protein
MTCSWHVREEECQVKFLIMMVSVDEAFLTAMYKFGRLQFWHQREEHARDMVLKKACILTQFFPLRCQLLPHLVNHHFLDLLASAACLL